MAYGIVIVLVGIPGDLLQLHTWLLPIFLVPFLIYYFDPLTESDYLSSQLSYGSCLLFTWCIKLGLGPGSSLAI